MDGKFTKPWLFHERTKLIPTMGFMPGANSPDPKAFLRKGDSDNVTLVPTKFKIKSCKIRRKTCDHGMPNLMKMRNRKGLDSASTRKNYMDEEDLDEEQDTVNEFTNFPDDLMNTPFRKTPQKVSKIRKGQGRAYALNKNTKSVSLNPIQEEDEISKGPISLRRISKGPVSLGQGFVGKGLKYPLEPLEKKNVLPTVSSRSNSSNYQTRMGGMGNFRNPGDTFECWRKNRNGPNPNNVLPEEDREKLREDLLVKWEALNREFQSFTHKRSLVISLVMRRKELEERMKFIEESLEKLDKPVVYVLPINSKNPIW